jgi:glutaconate CoA-transferase subunit A
LDTGFNTYRKKARIVGEIVEMFDQGRKNMGFAGHTATHDMEILSAGKVFDHLDVAHVIGLEARGLSTCSRK